MQESRDSITAKYLLDASAVFPLILSLKHVAFEHIDKFAAITLTPYEVGNALWKEVRFGKIKNREVVFNLFKEFLEGVTLIEIRPFWREIAELAIKENLTFYDASYLHVARVSNLKLVTEDSDLTKYPEAIRVSQLTKEIVL
ncbi:MULTISPECIES: type II toxin-antitoxin system VapC family toxin [unclassified Archaeoglobus]|jgi:predicted nucleic acid-binding protein|uniref:type II toxin-antitoxin system VapC family toxin n=1 Tax=unclassified Archaeoglobus TaxID=2643606 RepID=UPI0025BA273C|nr:MULTISPECIES: type II toxin-antitoxin system VapC family toxin [unclassified Archaeoglobus]